MDGQIVHALIDDFVKSSIVLFEYSPHSVQPPVYVCIDLYPFLQNKANSVDNYPWLKQKFFVGARLKFVENGEKTKLL